MRLYAAFLLTVALACETSTCAFGVQWGKSVNIRVAPWTVVVLQYQREACTGAIIDPTHVLTAGHCLYNVDAPIPLSQFVVEAGVSNFHHPLPSDHLQVRAVSKALLMPGYIPESRRSYANDLNASAHDLAVLILATPLDLDGSDARPAHLPVPDSRRPSGITRLVLAGFGQEQPN